LSPAWQRPRGLTETVSPSRQTAEAPSSRTSQLTAPALQVLAVLARGDGTASCTLADLAARAGVLPRTAHDVVRRLTAAGWIGAAPPEEHAGSRAHAVRLTRAGRTAARHSLDAARDAIALARDALGPSGSPIPVSVGSRVTGLDVSVALIIRAFLGTPAKPCHYSELAARTGIPGTSLERAISRMKAAGWVADALPPAPTGARGRPPSPLTLTLAGPVRVTARGGTPAQGRAHPNPRRSDGYCSEQAPSPWPAMTAGPGVSRPGDSACRPVPGIADARGGVVEGEVGDPLLGVLGNGRLDDPARLGEGEECGMANCRVAVMFCGAIRPFVLRGCTSTRVEAAEPDASQLAGT
jgi:DNA-binding MarR family transcriptional regulator